jgi:hypothetical protein
MDKQLDIRKEIERAELLAREVLVWWKEAKFWTTGEYGERNVFDAEPDFVTLALEIVGPFRIIVEKVWSEGLGDAKEGRVAFRIEGDPDEDAVMQAVESAESNAYLERYEQATKRGTWYLPNADSKLSVGDTITV